MKTKICRILNISSDTLPHRTENIYTSDYTDKHRFKTHKVSSLICVTSGVIFLIIAA